MGLISLLQSGHWKGAWVLTAIMFQNFIVYGCVNIASPFYVTHLTTRGIPKIIVGIIGMVPGIGYLFNLFYDFIEYLLCVKKISLRAIVCFLLAVLMLNCIGQGVAELLPKKYNQILTAILIIQRTFQGSLSFLTSNAAVKCCTTWFPDHIKLTVGLQVAVSYLGGAGAIFMGGYVYELFGYQMPFLFISVISIIFLGLNIIALPSTHDPVYVKSKRAGYSPDNAFGSDTEDHADYHDGDQVLRENEHVGVEEVEPTGGLSWLVIFPILAQSLTIVLEGFSTAITTPYLKEEFDISIDRGSSYVFTFYVAMMAGSATSGYILQLGWASASKVMGVGSFLGFIGVMLTFPGPYVPWLYRIVPHLAYVGITLQGFGCQLVTIATLPAIEDVHRVIGKRPYTKKNKCKATTLWLCSWMLVVYGGHLVALLVMKVTTYTFGGWLVAGCSLVSFLISIGLDTFKERSLERPADEQCEIEVNELAI